MSANGHSFIDILKIDIEGAEFATLEALLAAYAHEPSLPFGQLQLEIHARDSEYAQFPKFLEWWEKLEAAGLRPFWTEPNLVYVNLVRGVGPTLTEVGENWLIIIIYNSELMIFFVSSTPSSTSKETTILSPTPARHSGCQNLTALLYATTLPHVEPHHHLASSNLKSSQNPRQNQNLMYTHPPVGLEYTTHPLACLSPSDIYNL
jgi:Methyltransferase FkbM domain